MALLTELFPGRDLPRIEITNVSIDSRQMSEQSLFVAMPGARVDGHQFLPQVEAAGALAAVVSRRNPDLSLVQIEVEKPEDELGRLCAQVYCTKERRQSCLGFTGTDGKTTMASLADHILRHSGIASGFIGTTGVRWKGHDSGHASFTTPFPPQLHQTLQEMGKDDVSHICMEVSSHALVQNRVAGLHFKTACFSHLAVDHLDFHQTIENYASAKAALFEHLDQNTAVAILNADDLTSYLYFNQTKAPCIFYTLSPDIDADLAEQGMQKTYLGGEWADWQQKLLAQFPAKTRLKLRSSAGTQVWQARNIQADVRGYRFELVCKGESSQQYRTVPPSVNVQLPLFGKYNIGNAMAALASVFAATNLPLEQLAESLQHFPGVVGRMENAAAGLTSSWSVIVDFAHTPGAIAALLQELKGHLKVGAKLWTLCNSCGDRDRGKRSLIGEICQTYADEVILTLEEVGSEDPATILAEIEQGLCQKRTKPYYKIPLRQAAIRFAVSRLQPGDILVLPSLGDEESYAVRGGKLPYNDKLFARQIIGERLMVEALAEQSVWSQDNFYQVQRGGEKK